jgi:hypothetical protein
VEVSGAPTRLLKRFVILPLILRMRFYNCAAKKEMRFGILLVRDDDPPDRRQTPAGSTKAANSPSPGPLVQSTASSAALGGLTLFQYAQKMVMLVWLNNVYGGSKRK